MNRRLRGCSVGIWLRRAVNGGGGEAPAVWRNGEEEGLTLFLAFLFWHVIVQIDLIDIWGR